MYFDCDTDVVLDVYAAAVYTVMFDDAGSDVFAVHAVVVDAAADVSISLIKR